MSYRFPLKKSVLAVSLLCSYAHADGGETQTNEDAQNLGVLTVTVDKSKRAKLGEQVVGQKQLIQENIQSAQDLVRYNGEVAVAEVGRYGNKGFAVRGVDGNRVAMTLDGVGLPEVEVNELFAPYGYIYEGRFNPDLESMSSVRIAAGADSIVSGSGAVGGSVAYRTKEPSHLLGGKDFGGYAKLGYNNKNSEFVQALGIAKKLGNGELMMNYTHRTGHELKNHDMRPFDKARQDLNYDFAGKGEMGRASQPSSAFYPDAKTYRRHSLLTKAYYRPNDNHRFGVSAFYQQQNSDSFAFSQSTTGPMRMPKDRETLKSYGADYEFVGDGDEDKLDKLTLKYQHQEVLGLADSWLYAGFPTMVLSRREYRPTDTKTDQLKLDAVLAPMDFDKLGNHSLSLSAALSHQDYKATGVHVDYKPDGTMGDAIQPYVIPYPDAKKFIANVVAQDKIIVNDKLSANLGLRYDYYRYRPYFQNDTWFGDPQSNEQNELANNYNNTRLKFYSDYRAGVYNQSSVFQKLTQSGGLDYKVTPQLTARYKIGTGFLVPSVTQLYSAFQGFGVQQIINTDLKPETSLNQELELFYGKAPLSLWGSVYQSNYKNFIHSAYWDSKDKPALSAKYDCRSTCIQSQNLDTAKIQGLKLGIGYDLSRLVKSGKLTAYGEYHTAKDEATAGTDHPEDGTLIINTLAAVPTNAIVGLDYEKDKLSLSLRARFDKAKQPNDTKYVKVEPDDTRRAGYKEVVGTFKHLERGRDTWVLDAFGTYNATQDISIQAGVYNLTNQKYIPWQALRQLGNATVNSGVDSAGHGFNRYSAPGRNYAISVSYRF